MTSSSISRRATLGVLGAGSALAFAGCASRVQPLSADASTSYRADYSGEVTFNSYDTSAGEYVRATRTQRAKNVPKPVKTAMMTEKSSAGLYSLFGFLGAAFTYGIMTNDFSPFKEITFVGGINGAEAFEESSVKELENMWFEDPKMTFTLKDPTPTQNGDVYTWAATTTFSTGNFVVYEGTAVDIPSEAKKDVHDGEFKARYNNGRWLLIDIPTNTDLSSSFGSAGNLSA